METEKLTSESSENDQKRFRLNSSWEHFRNLLFETASLSPFHYLPERNNPPIENLQINTGDCREKVSIKAKFSSVVLERVNRDPGVAGTRRSSRWCMDNWRMVGRLRAGVRHATRR